MANHETVAHSCPACGGGLDGPGKCGFCGTYVTFEKEGKEVKRFTREAKARLAANGFTIVQLSGEQLQDLRAAGLSLGDKSAKFELKRAQSTEAAVNLDALFLPGSGNKTFQEQCSLVEAYRKELQQKYGITGITVAIPEAVDLMVILSKLPESVLYTQLDSSNIPSYARTNTREGVCLTDVSFDARRQHSSKPTFYIGGIYLESYQKSNFLGIIPIIYPA